MLIINNAIMTQQKQHYNHNLSIKFIGCLKRILRNRALCRIKLLPVTYVLVDTWMFTVKLVFRCAWWPEMGYKHTYDTICTHFQGITSNLYDFWRPFLSPPVHLYFCPSIFVFTHPNDGWSGLYIKLCCITCSHSTDYCINNVELCCITEQW